MLTETAVRVVVLANHAYAAITGRGYSLDVRLDPGRSPEVALMQSAEEDRKQAEHLLQRAARKEEAATILRRGAASAVERAA